jgi:hypothetical protein
MNIASFDDLLQVARQQPEPQRLLFVFAGAELPDDSSAAQRAQFLMGEGGALVPLMCVDKTPQEINSFADLVKESLEFGKPWTIVFAAAMSSNDGTQPSSEAAEKPLQKMVEAIKAGKLGSYIPFDREGHPVALN